MTMAHGFRRRSRNFCTAAVFFSPTRCLFSGIFNSAALFMGVLLLCAFWHQSTLIQDKHQLISRKHTHARNKFTLQTRRVLFSLHFVSTRRPTPSLYCRMCCCCCFYRNWQEREIIINTITLLGMERRRWCFHSVCCVKVLWLCARECLC